MSYVYFIGCNFDNRLRVKIGYTSRNPHARMADFQPGSPAELDILCYIPGDLALERKLHETFSTCRLHNEWFEPFGLMERLVLRLMTEGRGARDVTAYDVFLKAMYETVYDWAPLPENDGKEDFMLLMESAETSLWDDDFAHILAEHWAALKAKETVQ